MSNEQNADRNSQRTSEESGKQFEADAGSWMFSAGSAMFSSVRTFQRRIYLRFPQFRKAQPLLRLSRAIKRRTSDSIFAS